MIDWSWKDFHVQPIWKSNSHITTHACSKWEPKRSQKYAYINICGSNPKVNWKKRTHVSKNTECRADAEHKKKLYKTKLQNRTLLRYLINNLFLLTQAGGIFCALQTMTECHIPKLIMRKVFPTDAEIKKRVPKKLASWITIQQLGHTFSCNFLKLLLHPFYVVRWMHTEDIKHIKQDTCNYVAMNELLKMTKCVLQEGWSFRQSKI